MFSSEQEVELQALQQEPRDARAEGGDAGIGIRRRPAARNSEEDRRPSRRTDMRGRPSGGWGPDGPPRRLVELPENGRADSGASQLAVAAHAGEASGEEAGGERRGADAQEDGRWHHSSPVVEQAEADGGGKRQREM